jgi:hypothetical protein
MLQRLHEDVVTPAVSSVGRVATNIAAAPLDLLQASRHVGAAMDSKLFGTPFKAPQYVSPYLHQKLGIEASPDQSFEMRTLENLGSSIYNPYARATRGVTQALYDKVRNVPMTMPQPPQVAAPTIPPKPPGQSQPVNLPPRPSPDMPLGTPLVAPTQVATPHAQMAGNVAQAIFGTAGGDIGAQSGLPYELGPLVGSIAGGSVPAMAGAGGSWASKKIVGRTGETGAEARNALDAVGIPPRAMYTGGRPMALTGQGVMNMPGLGATTTSRHLGDLQTFQGRVNDTANMIVGPNSTLPPAHFQEPAMLAEAGALAAQEARRRLDASTDQLFINPTSGFTGDELYSPSRTLQAAGQLQDTWRKSPLTAQGAQETVNDLTLSIKQPTRTMPAVGGAMSALTHPGGQTVTVPGDINPSTGNAASQMGIPLMAAREIRRNIGMQGDGRVGLNADAKKQLYGPNTEDIEAGLNAIDPRRADQWQLADRTYNAEQDKAAAAPYAPPFDPATGVENPGGGGAFPRLDKMDAASPETAPKVFANPYNVSVLHRLAPDAAAPIAGLVYATGAQMPNPIYGAVNVSPSRVAANYDRTPTPTREAMAGGNPVAAGRMAQEANAGRVMREFDAEQNRSKSAAMLSALGAMGMFFDPESALKLGVPAKALDYAISSPTVGRFIARANPEILNQLYQRGIRSGRIGVQEEAQREDPANRGRASAVFGNPTRPPWLR